MTTYEQPPRRTSVLAAFCFLSGIGALALALTAGFLANLAGMGDLASFDATKRDGLMLASRIVGTVSLGPALFAVAFWLAARGAVRESNGEVGGRGLYRAGTIIAVFSTMYAWSDWPALDGAGRKFIARIETKFSDGDDDGFLGVDSSTISGKEARSLGIGGGAVVKKVIAGTAAAAAGIQAGDVIYEIDGKAVEDQGDLVDIISECEPEAQEVEIRFLRGGAKNTVKTRLGRRGVPFSTRAQPKTAPPTPEPPEPREH